MQPTVRASKPSYKVEGQACSPLQALHALHLHALPGKPTVRAKSLVMFMGKDFNGEDVQSMQPTERAHEVKGQGRPLYVDSEGRHAVSMKPTVRESGHEV